MLPRQLFLERHERLPNVGGAEGVSENTEMNHTEKISEIYSFTIVFPKLLPLSILMKAVGTFSKPSVMSSLILI